MRSSTQQVAVASRELDANDLSLAIATDQLTLHYQPQVDMSKGSVSGVEALVRWQHPEFGTLPPKHFIPLAEESMLITQLTRWVMDSAISQMAVWQSMGIKLRMSMNLSAGDIHKSSEVDLIARLLKTWGIDPEFLSFEVTESSFIGNHKLMRRELSRLRTMGAGIALDDFGTKYSTLTNLKLVPATILKLDRSFVRSMGQNNRDFRIIHSTIELAHSLGLRVVAEGVETEAIWNLLCDLGCDLAQGYFIGRPMGASELENWLKSWTGAESGTDDVVLDYTDDYDSSAQPAASPRSSSRPPTSVLVVEDHTLLRESLVKAISSEPDFEVAAQAGSFAEALSVSRIRKPTLAILDVTLPDLDGITLAVELRRQYPELKIVFLTMHEDDASIRRAAEIRADGYVSKTISAFELMRALHVVADGGSYLSPFIAERLLAVARDLLDRKKER